jgi:hypothetical protein
LRLFSAGTFIGFIAQGPMKMGFLRNVSFRQAKKCSDLVSPAIAN